MSDIKLLNQYAKSCNVAMYLGKEELEKIGKRVLLGFEEDLLSMQEWLSDVRRIEELANLKSVKKSTPLPNSANVKIPLIIKACIEFASAVYPEIIKDDKIVRTCVIGHDYDGKKATMGLRASAFMNYQLLFENQDWELESDRLFTQLGLIGFICKKTYYDPIRNINKSEICDHKELIIHSNIKSLEDASRITQILHLRMNDFIEAKNKEVEGCPVFLSEPVDELALLNEHDQLDKNIDILEQHCKLDLDKDGYAEPYIVTILKDSGKILRIVPRFTKDDICIEKSKVCYITPIHCFVDYHFLPSPSGKFQSVGFGILLLHINEMVNSVFNMLADSGQLANMQGGYKDARLKIIPSGNSNHKMGEWKDLKVAMGTTVKEGMIPITYKEPSHVLYQLLNLLMEVARDFSSSAQINNGTQSSENAKTGATMALQQAGKKTHNAIAKRIYRSMSKEFRQLFDLNYRYLDPITYKEVVDDSLAVKQTDFDSKALKILPVADPNLSSAAQRLQESQFIDAVSQRPGIDQLKATKAILTRSDIPDIMEIMTDPKAPKQPDIKMLELQGKMEKDAQELNIKGREVELAEKDQLIKAHVSEADIKLKECQAELALAQARAQPLVTQLKDLQLQFDIISKKVDAQLTLGDMQHQKDMQQSDQEHQQNMQSQQPQGGQNEAETPGTVAPVGSNAGSEEPDPTA